MSANLILPKGTVVPNHIALVLDGNRRWARARGLKPWEGHRAGYGAVKALAHASRQFGVHTFTIWAFSTENWERSKEEIGQMFRLLHKGLLEFEGECHKYETRLIHLGRKDRFPKELAEEIARIERETAHYDRNILNLALDYGGRDEIIRATKRIVSENIPVGEIDEKLYDKYLDTKDQPYPYVDLFIRTSGEQRTSGLLPWQMTYAEYYFEPELLPDFTPEKLRGTILDFSRRRRRFGGNDSAAHLAFDPKISARLELSWWRLAHVPEGMRLRDYAMKHIKEQFGLSSRLAIKAAKYLVQAIAEEKDEKWEKAVGNMKKFYQLVKGEIKLAFEPKIVASLDVNLRQGKGEDEETTKEYLAEVYRISLLQAAKAAHLRVLAETERNKGNWKKAEDYLQKYYSALKERVA
jgi:undecaprenyl diphosphate synthase